MHPVEPGGDAAAVKSEIAAQLPELLDPDTHEKAIEHVYTREKLFSGPCTELGPDLVVGFRPGYRTSWQSAVGGTPDTLIEDNLESWSGDHLIDPSHVPGILFVNRSLDSADPHLTNIAPTLLSILGLPTPADMEGASLI